MATESKNRLAELVVVRASCFDSVGRRKIFKYMLYLHIRRQLFKWAGICGGAKVVQNPQQPGR